MAQIRSKAFCCFGGLLIVLGLLAGCGGGPASPTLPPLLTTDTPPVEVSPTASSTWTAEPSPTPTLSASATPTQPPLTLSGLTSYSIPAWLGDPKAPVLMQWLRRTGSDSGTLSFLNPATGEWADLPYPADAAYYFWFDSTHFGFLSTDLASMTLVDLATGRVTSQPTTASTTKWIDPTSASPQALQVKRKPASPDVFIFDAIDQPRSRILNRSWRFTAQVNWDLAGNPIKVVDNETGETLWESDLKDGMWESEFAWSPHINGVIAFVRGSPQSETSSLITRNTELTLINVNTEKVVAEFKADMGNIKWSADGSRILYESVFARYATMGVGSKAPACILDTLSLSNRCLWNISQAPPPSGYQLETTGLYSWSADGQSIRYMVLYSDGANDPAYVGNVCIEKLVDGTFFCPTASVQEPNGWGISYYDVSPDGQFINYCYSKSTILDNYIGEGYDALIRTDGTGFRSWSGLSAEGKPVCSYFNQVWRPQP